MKQMAFSTLLATLIIAGSAGASAGTIALEFSTPPVNDWHWTGATIGWEFTTSNDLDITSLGVWDKDSDGLADSHQVGIFTLGGSLLTSTTVNSGTGNTLESEFRWADLAGSFNLSAGTYVVGAYMATSADRGAAAASITTSSDVTFNRNLFLYGSGFSLPTNYWSGHDAGNFGANFQYESAAVPGPAPLGLFVLALAGLFFKRSQVA
ncbi:MAG: hypothetical protein ACI8Z1_001740 [Candidatus Azotimanducaceae bacterium]|jgi:hypothetical protein